MKIRALLLALCLCFCTIESNASFWNKLKTIGGFFCPPWTKWLSTPAKTVDMGGKSSANNPLINVSVRYYGGCSHGQKENTITLGQTWTMETCWTGRAYLTPGTGLTACCSASDEVYQGASFEKTNQFCTVPDFDSTFANGECDDCSCGNAKTLSEAYGCSATKTFSYFCKQKISFPYNCVMGKNVGTVLSAFEDLTTYGCWPTPQGMNPPSFCECNLPGAPMPEAMAYPICSLGNPPSLYSGKPGSYTTNNCAPIYKGDSTSYVPPTYLLPYARVQFNNPMPVQGWATSSQSSTLTDCESIYGKQLTGGFIANCLGPCQGAENCVSGSSGTTVPSGYISSGQTVPSKEEYAKIFLFGSDTTSPNSLGSNIALTNKPVGNTPLKPYGVNISQFGDIAFNFSKLTSKSNSNCNIENAGNPSECGGTETLSLKDHTDTTAGSGRTFATYLPPDCNTSGGSDSLEPSQCNQFCVAETFLYSPPKKLGCFSRPLPKQGINLGICSKEKNTGSCSYNSLTGSNVTMSSSDFPEYNSNSKWCYALQVEKDQHPLCGENSFSKQSGAQIGGTNGNTIFSIFTNLAYQYPDPSVTNYCARPNSANSSTDCAIGTLKYWGYNASKPTQTSFSATDKTQSSYNLLVSNASVACPLGLTKQNICSKACQQDPSDSNKWYGDTPDEPCNCILAPNDFCSPSNQVLPTSYSTSDTSNPCSSDSEIIASLLPQARITDPSTPADSISKSSDLDNLVALSEAAYIPPNQSFSDTEKTRGRTPFESGLCVPMTMWDPVDCGTMFGNSSQLVSDINNKKVNLPDNISTEDLYNSCQSFVCDYCTVNKNVNSNLSSEEQNDYYYIQDRCNSIYQKCAGGSTLSDTDLIDPSLLQSVSQSTYTTANENIKKIASVYGYNTICSYFQPGIKTNSSRTSAECTYSDKVQDSSSKSVSYCGCFAPGNYYVPPVNNNNNNNNNKNHHGTVGGNIIIKKIPIESANIVKECTGNQQNCAAYITEWCRTLGSGITSASIDNTLCCSNGDGKCTVTNSCNTPSGFTLPDEIYKDTLVQFMMKYGFEQPFCLYQLATNCMNMNSNEIECASKDGGKTYSCLCAVQPLNCTGPDKFSNPRCNSSAPVIDGPSSNPFGNSFEVAPEVVAVKKPDVTTTSSSSSKGSFVDPVNVYCYDTSKNDANVTKFDISKLPNIGKQFSQNISIKNVC